MSLFSSLPKFSQSALMLALSSVLAACSGGSDGEGEAPAPAPNTLVALSGSVVVTNNSGIDGDLESIGTRFNTANNSVSDAQIITNPLTLGGYLSGTAGRYDSTDDNSAYARDAIDVYEVVLIKGQRISLSSFYADSDDRTRAASANLRLSLAPVANANNVSFVDLSGQDNGSLTVPSSGNYHITLSAGDNTTVPMLYVLSLSQTTSDSSGQALALDNRFDMNLLGQDFVPGELIVKYKTANNNAGNRSGALSRDNSGASINAASQALMQNMSAQSQLGEATLYRLDLASMGQKAGAAASSLRSLGADLDHPLSAEQQQKWQTLEAMATLQQDANIDYVEPNYLYKATAVISSPADIGDAEYRRQWNMPMIEAPAAWQVATGEGVRVAVIDSGIHPDHLDLDDNIPANQGYDFVSITDIEKDNQPGPDNDPTDTGSTNHGTHVAGIIAAEGNSIGIRGVAYDADIIPLRALGADGVGSTSDIANAVRYAAGLNVSAANGRRIQKADIINMSLGSDNRSITLERAILAAQAEGVMIVAAAGNESTSANSYPAAFANVIGVSSVNEAKRRSGFSNFGLANVDVAAPGGTGSRDEAANGDSLFDGFQDGILSTVSDDRYAQLVGTSMAAPHVAGVIALMKQRRPSLTTAQFLQFLANGDLTDNINDPGFTAAQNRDFFGAGLINAAKAVSAVGAALPATLVVSPTNLGFVDGITRTPLTLSNPGSGTITINSISDDAPWLNDITLLTNNGGLGEYQVEISAGQAPSIGSATISISYSINGVAQAEPIKVGVFVSKSDVTGEVDTVGDLFVYLVRYEDFENSQSDDVVDVYATVGGVLNEGVYSFNFQNIPAGRYLLEASTNNDGDGLVFDGGEARGSYPILAAPRFIDVVADDITGLSFEVAYQSSISAQTLSDSGSNAPVQTPVQQQPKPRKLPESSAR